jgi:transcriptional regulator with GAF, ATPase, and Fis domain
MPPEVRRLHRARILGEDSPEVCELVRSTIEKDLGAPYPWPGNVRELEQCARRGEGDAHPRATPDEALDENFPAKRMNLGARSRKSETSGGGIVLRREERIEDVRKVVGFDSNAGIRDDHGDVAARILTGLDDDVIGVRRRTAGG